MLNPLVFKVTSACLPSQGYALNSCNVGRCTGGGLENSINVRSRGAPSNCEDILTPQGGRWCGNEVEEMEGALLQHLRMQVVLCRLLSQSLQTMPICPSSGTSVPCDIIPVLLRCPYMTCNFTTPSSSVQTPGFTAVLSATSTVSFAT